MNSSMEDLPEALLGEIINRVTSKSDLNSLSLVSKRLYTAEGNQRGDIRIGCSFFPANETLASLCCRRFPNLSEVVIDYSGRPLSFWACIDDTGLRCLANCKKLMSLTLNSVSNITSRGLLSVVAGCKSLSALHIIDCKKIGSVEWLEYLSWNGSLEELVVKHCDGISQHDLLKFGPGWMKLWKFEYETKGGAWDIHGGYEGHDLLYDAHNPSRYDFCCENLKDLRLVRIQTGSETGVGLRFLLGKCKILEKLCLEYVKGLNDNDMIALSRSCANLQSISLWLMPQRCDNGYQHYYRTAFTDHSLEALALSCPMLQTVELAFAGCEHMFNSSQIGFTQEGLVLLIQSCPIRVLVLDGAEFFDDEGMMALSSAPFLETLELVDCEMITDAGMRFVARTPCLSSLTLRLCEGVTDDGVAELVHAPKLESLIIEGCRSVSQQAVQGVLHRVCKL